MSVKWHLLKELKLSFKTLSFNDVNDSFDHGHNSLMRKVEVERTLPGRSRISFSTGSQHSSLVPRPEHLASPAVSKAMLGLSLVISRFSTCIHIQLVLIPTSCVQLPPFD